MNWKRQNRAILFAGAILIAPAALACSSNNNGSNVANHAAEPGFNATVSAETSTPGATGGSAASPAALAAAGAQTLNEVTTDNKYSSTSLTAKPNQDIALTQTNNGQAVHNWHLLDAKDANGNDIKTALLDAGKSETIVFRIGKPGTYHFQCDVHPADMKGTLTIK